MQAIELMSKLYGTNCFDVDDQMGVTTIPAASTQFLQNDPNCIQLTIINTGANDINVWTDPSVSATKGIRIAGNGGSYEIDFTRFGTYPTRTWFGFGVGGSSTISTKRLISSNT